MHVNITHLSSNKAYEHLLFGSCSNKVINKQLTVGLLPAWRHNMNNCIYVDIAIATLNESILWQQLTVCYKNSVALQLKVY